MHIIHELFSYKRIDINELNNYRSES